MADRVAARFKAAHTKEAVVPFKVGTPEDLLKIVEEAEGLLHTAVHRMTSRPEDATREEQVKYARIERAIKALHDQSENIRLDLDEWIIDYHDARRS